VKTSEVETCAKQMDISEIQFAEETVFSYNVKSSFHYKLQIISNTPRITNNILQNFVSQHQMTWHYIPDEIALHNNHCENPQFYRFNNFQNTQNNCAVSNVIKTFVSHPTRAQHTLSATGTVQVSHALITILQCVQLGSHDTSTQ
jgi:hypothetical protein